MTIKKVNQLHHTKAKVWNKRIVEVEEFNLLSPPEMKLREND